MSKVKIVQMTLAMATDSVNGYEERSEYLDDQGRVWYQVAVDVGSTRPPRFEWRQLDLPEEPES